MPNRPLTLVLLACLLLAACTAPPATSVVLQAETLLPTGPTPACPATVVCPTIAPPPATATAVPSPPAPRSVVLLSFDGGPAGEIYARLEAGDLPNFALLAQQGIRAEYALSVDPSLTVPAQNSITTGAYPNRTGLVSNAYHTPIDSFYWYRTGFDELLEQAEPVWVTASRAGLRTAALFFVGGSPALPKQAADYTIGYGIEDAYSRQEVISLAPLAEEWSGELPPSFSPPLEGWWWVFSQGRVYLYAVDSQDDEISQYDTIILSTERRVGADNPRLETGEWGSLVVSPGLVSGADFLLQSIRAEEPVQVTLYHSAVSHNTAMPRQLLQELNERFGFFPSGADSYALKQGWITQEDYLWQIERSNRWIAEVTAWVLDSYRPDLTLAWLNGFDAAGHAFYLRAERQPGYTPEQAAKLQRLYQSAASSADQALGAILQAVDLKNTTVLLASDHGMAPTHTTVYVNKVLEQAGLLRLDRRNYVIVERSKALAVASGGAANIYINRLGYEKDGIVAPEDYTALQTQIATLFRELTDPATGEAAFARVALRQELPALHLDHLHSGDIFLQASPGYTLDHQRGAPAVFGPAAVFGQHGYDSALPEMRPFFIAAGAGVPASGAVIPAIRLVDLAPTIAWLLGFPPASSMDGQPIPALLSQP